MRKQFTVSVEQLTKRIDVTQGRIPADLVIKNGSIINVYTSEITFGDIAIVDGLIVAVGGNFEGKQEIDAQGKFISPSFIDGHIHIESTTLTPSEFAKIALPNGLTTIITDPHEIANVLGVKGIQYMLKNSEATPMDIFYVLPSCVPSTSFENAGATLTSHDLAPLYNHPNVIGLAEVMDYPAIIGAKRDMMEKILDAHAHGGTIDGHLAGLSTNEINAYLAVGIRNDHECTTAEEALDRVRLGMRVMIRQGSASKNLPALIKAVNRQNAHRFSFCTDDKHLDELIEEGSINYCVKQAISLGLDPFIAFQMATINTAQCFNLQDRGAISPGLKADLLILTNMKEINIETVIKNGVVVVENKILKNEWDYTLDHLEGCTETVNMIPLTSEDLKIKPLQERASIIEILPNQIITNHIKAKVPLDEDGFFIPSVSHNLQKLVVTERHQKRGTTGVGIVKGFQMTKNSAIASTVAHDSHNVIAAGTSDEAILVACQWLEEHQGGLVVVKDGSVIGEMELRLAGLMSIKTVQDAAQDLASINKALSIISPKATFNLFSTLSFLALPVIPSLKLTDLGLFNVQEFTHIKV